ncbi:MAG: hydantoinase/oxoprolinase family protein, partial [Thermoleophilia bacterium]|nr:hydantoinase/oxoprolinase family protein [Thermoleophilia bacterium]
MTEGHRRARIGVDAGGTFVDVVVVEPEGGRACSAKVPSDGRLEGAMEAASELVAGPPEAVVAGTTRVTNAILEGRLARTALVTTEGFRDVLAIGRQARDD